LRSGQQYDAASQGKGGRYGDGVGVPRQPDLYRAAGVPSPAELVEAAHAGQQPAWNELVERYAGLVWSVARVHRLGPADAADVSQTVWLRLVENLDRIRDPEHLGGWLATTARHECLRVLRRGGREILEEEPADVPGRVEDSPEWQLLATEQRRSVWLGLSRLSDRCRQLLRSLAYSPEASYADVSNALDMPIGSIGPTRSRCLEQLRRQLVELGFIGADDRRR
jgi:RNA polymerase sigma factor (sigma-70 family)